MTASTDKFDKKMKKLIKADWTAKEVAAVSHRLNKRPFAAQADTPQETAAFKDSEKRRELISQVVDANDKDIEGMLFVLEKILQAARKNKPAARIRRRRVRNW